MATLSTKHMVGAVIAAVAVVFIATKCGDAYTFGIRTSDWDDSADGSPLSTLNGAIVELEHVSSRCDDGVSDGLMARVGSDIEFPGESVVEIEPPCVNGRAVQLDVDVEGRSIVYDFCNVEGAGRFPEAEFEGFVVTDAFHLVAPIRGVTIDRDKSTMNMSDAAISFDEHTVRVNLAGLEYDDTCRVKLDLVLETDPETTELKES